MAIEGMATTSDGVAFLVSAGVVYEVIAAACSSPQTTEINAQMRSDTLMKWVWIGVGQAVLLVAIAAAVDVQHRGAILAGGALGVVLLVAQYMHAKSSGLANPGPATESYGG